MINTEVPLKYRQWYVVLKNLDRTLVRLDWEIYRTRLQLPIYPTGAQEEFVRQLEVERARLQAQRVEVQGWTHRATPTILDRLVCWFYDWVIRGETEVSRLSR